MQGRCGFMAHKITQKIVNIQTNEETVIERDMTNDELAQYQKDQAEAALMEAEAEAKAAAKAVAEAKLAALGLTAEDLKALGL